MKLGGKKSNTVQMRWEHDYQLIENEGLFDEYLEMGKFFSGALLVGSVDDWILGGRIDHLL